MTDYGTIETIGDGRYVLRYERRLRHPVEKVWAALTEPRQIEQWWARAAELELTEGGRARFEWLNGPAVAQGRITRLEPPTAIEFDTDIHGRLRWELEPDGDATLLTFTAEVELPEEYELEVLAGWHIHLDHLEDVLDGGTIDWPNWARDHMPAWERIRERYAADTEEPAAQPRSSS
jgi:uncharacterized protein YndB with AHSA1/START domain